MFISSVTSFKYNSSSVMEKNMDLVDSLLWKHKRWINFFTINWFNFLPCDLHAFSNSLTLMSQTKSFYIKQTKAEVKFI